MGLKVITPPAEVLTLAELKVHLRLGSGARPDDDLVLAMLGAAHGIAEHHTKRAIGRQTLELALDAFPPGAEAIELQHGPAVQVSSITYTDEDGATQTLSDTLYALDEYSKPQWVLPTYGNEWPATRDTANAVKVRYLAGESTVPAAALAAIKLIVTHLYENRGDEGAKVTELPPAACALLDTVAVWGF